MARNANNIISNILFASLLATGVAAGAQAQAPSARDITNRLPSSAGNVVGGGGGGATLSGGGGGAAAGVLQPGRSARLQGDGDGQQVVYLGPAPVRAGRAAWLSGGGDDAEVWCTPRRTGAAEGARGGPVVHPSRPAGRMYSPGE